MTNVDQYSATIESRKLYSIKALATFLGCSTVTAQKFKNEGRFSYYQVGRKCIFDTEKVLAALEHSTKKTGR